MEARGKSAWWNTYHWHTIAYRHSIQGAYSQTISNHLKNRWRMMEDDGGWWRMIADDCGMLWTATTCWNPTMSWAGCPQLCVSHQPSRAARWCRAGNLSPELCGMVILLHSYIGAFDVSRIQLNLVIGILAANVAYIEGFHNNHIVGEKFSTLPSESIFLLYTFSALAVQDSSR